MLLVLLIASERLGPALALMGFLAPLVAARPHAVAALAERRRPAPGSASEVETDYLRMRLDHDTGAMSGTVRRGPFAGRRLDELVRGRALELWRECRVGTRPRRG